ncbi:P-loop NTPase [candidate division KSB1 bacterium]|nr:P-loop NTPase [candidate division KSB1 bacterium]
MENSLKVRVDEKQYGPVTKSELRAMVRKGKFSLNDYVWDEEESEWVQAEQLEDLRKLVSVDKLEETKRKVIAVGSGKGGVGKTVLTASLGVGLAALGKEVILVDADFGGANLHICMGLLEPKYTFLDYYTMERETLQDIIVDSPIENLKLISGACGTLGIANPKYSQKQKLIRDLRNLPGDYVIMDLGAGSSLNVIDFFLAVDEGLVVTTPEPMALQESFDFIKLCLIRKLQQAFKNEPEILTILAIDGLNNLTQLTAPITELLENARKTSSEIADRIESEVDSFRPRLILNMVMEPDEIKEGMSMKTAAADLLGIDLDYIGYIEFDEGLRQSIKDLRPFILHNPRSIASRSIAKIITIKFLKQTRLESAIKNWRMRRTIQSQSDGYPKDAEKNSDTICSHNCFYWDDCEFQNGGLPCRIRHLEPIFKI